MNHRKWVTYQIQLQVSNQYKIYSYALSTFPARAWMVWFDVLVCQYTVAMSTIVVSLDVHVLPCYCFYIVSLVVFLIIGYENCINGYFGLAS